MLVGNYFIGSPNNANKDRYAGNVNQFIDWKKQNPGEYERWKNELGLNGRNVDDFKKIVKGLLEKANRYANEMANYGNNKYEPKISGENATIAKYDENTYKIGPFKLNYINNVNLKYISSLKITQSGTELSFDTNRYLYANGSRGENLPTSGEEFYLMVKKFDVSADNNIKVIMEISYFSYENINLYVARYLGEGAEYIQPILIGEGRPNTGVARRIIDINLIEPTNYKISLSKKDTIFNEAVTNAEFSIKLGNGTTKTMTTNSNGVADITLTADSVGTETITITETKVGDKWKLLTKPITLKVTKTIENNKCVVTSIAQGDNLPSGTTMSYDKGSAIIKINAQDPTNLATGKYTLNFNKLDSVSGGILKGAVFDMYINGIPKTIRPNSDGTYNPVSVPITEEGIDTIQIVEKSAPNNYKKLNGTLILEITKKADKSSWSYVATDVKITKKFKDENNNDIDAAIITYDKNSHTIKLDIKNERDKIKLSGYVWEDIPVGKETAIDGKKNNNDKFISGIQVTLHTSDNKNILYTNSPTLKTNTNDNGYYEFEVPSGAQYYIEFTYNGQNYQHTKYTTWTGRANPITSNATETQKERKELNKKFELIYPNMTVDGTTIDNTINEKGASYIKDECYRISAYTGAYGNEKDIKYYSTTSENINLGLTKRETADLAIRKDVYKAALSINGYSQDYVYNRREGLETDDNGNSYWDIRARQSDVYYGTNYEREVRSSDYNYNGENKLSAEVTYKVTIRNQSGALNTKITELVDYYDADYTYKEAYVLNGDNRTNLIASGNSKYTHNTTIANYQKIYFDMSNITIKPGADLEVYVVFTVKVDDSGKIIVDDGNGDIGKGNLIEIMGYKTYYGDNVKSPNDGNPITYTEYKPGDTAGKVDVDSNPGNITSTDENKFEDDTDRAPYTKFTITNNGRTAKGVVWEDQRTVEEGNATVGDGVRQENEPLVGNITVELWNADTGEIAKVWDGTKWIDARTESNEGSGYEISNFIPGNYYARFIYQDGQNYKSTTYNYEKVNPDFDINNPDSLGTYKETTDVHYSDARDIWGDVGTKGTRSFVNNEYISAGIMTNSKEKEMQDKLLANEYEVHAVTGKIYVNFEADTNDTNSNSGRLYELKNIDFGLQMRPKAQLITSKEIKNAKVTLANGSILFDASGRATNVTWHNKKIHEYGYDGKLMKQPIVNRGSQQVLLTMDEELMHGANINITYKISVKNIGEVDYPSMKFYYTGKKAEGDKAVTTTIYDIVDYAGASGKADEKNVYNNLKFNASLNPGWNIIAASQLKNDGLVSIVDEQNIDKTDNIQKYNTILKYTFEKELQPEIENSNESSVDTTLTLSQVITPDSNSDDQKYSNMIEILSFKNGIGRKMAYSKVGNQNPDGDIAEVDADIAQLTILPPFGEKNVYYILGTVIATIIIVGIIIIKKKVITK